MKLNPAFIILILANIMGHNAFGQEYQFKYMRPIEENSQTWHKIVLPDEIFEKSRNDLSDIRILGITNQQDTIEVPYMLNMLQDHIEHKEVGFKILNQSRKEDQYFFVMEVKSKEEINTINLKFKEENFDWKISLDGSDDMTEWYNIQSGYRIVSVKNQWTDYSFSTVRFPNSIYRFYRVTILETDKQPELVSASVNLEKIVSGTYKTYPVKKNEKEESKKRKETVLDITLPYAVPVSFLKIHILDSIDYYRNFSVRYVSDSIHSPKGWNYHYETLYSGVLSSLEENEFKFRNATSSMWKVIINNQDNAPLKIEKVEVGGNVHELVGRFGGRADYFLFYGQDNLNRPSYDLEKFKENIPAKVVNLNLGDELSIPQKEIVKAKPLFENQLWLWGIMTVIIVVLGVFSLKMIRKVD
ncbi:MAG: DUF3999 family protein [Bacteroidota bacterium]|nr:DUF3999 family protein [Bacteroidota bacterium]